MWMANDEFITYPVNDIDELKLFLLTANFRIKYNVQQNISQFFFNTLPVRFSNGISQFIRFFNGKLTQYVDGFFFIPWAFLPQFIHYCNKSLKRIQQWFIHHH